MNRPPVESVDAYIAAQPEDQWPALMEIRDNIRKAAPKAEEVIRYGAPYYKYHGFVAGFAAYKHHIRFGIIGSPIDDETREALKEKGYSVLKRSIQIPYDQKIPTKEIRHLVEEKMKENSLTTV